MIDNIELNNTTFQYLEFLTLSQFPVTGELGIVYIDISTNIRYVWLYYAYVVDNNTIVVDSNIQMSRSVAPTQAPPITTVVPIPTAVPIHIPIGTTSFVTSSIATTIINKPSILLKWSHDPSLDAIELGLLYPGDKYIVKWYSNNALDGWYVGLSLIKKTPNSPDIGPSEFFLNQSGGQFGPLQGEIKESSLPDDAIGTIYTYSVTLYANNSTSNPAIISTYSIDIPVIKRPVLTLTANLLSGYPGDPYTLSWSTSDYTPASWYATINSLPTKQLLSGSYDTTFSGIKNVGKLYSSLGVLINTATLNVIMLNPPVVTLTGPLFGYIGEPFNVNWTTQYATTGMSVNLDVRMNDIAVTTIPNQLVNGSSTINDIPKDINGNIFKITASVVDINGRVFPGNTISVPMYNHPTITLSASATTIDPSVLTDYYAYDGVAFTLTWLSVIPIGFPSTAQLVKFNFTGDKTYSRNVVGDVGKSTVSDTIPAGTPAGIVKTYIATLYDVSNGVYTALASSAITVTVRDIPNITITTSSNPVYYDLSGTYNISWIATSYPIGSYVKYYDATGQVINVQLIGSSQYKTLPTDSPSSKAYRVVLYDKFNRELASANCIINIVHSPIPIQVRAWMGSEPNRMSNAGTRPGTVFPFYVTVMGDNIPVGAYFTVPILTGKWLFTGSEAANQTYYRNNNMHYNLPLVDIYTLPAYSWNVVYVWNYVPMGTRGGTTFHGVVTLHGPDGAVLGSASTAGYDTFPTGYPPSQKWIDELPHYNSCDGQNLGHGIILSTENCEFYNYNMPKPYWWTLPW